MGIIMFKALAANFQAKLFITRKLFLPVHWECKEQQIGTMFIQTKTKSLRYMRSAQRSI